MSDFEIEYYEKIVPNAFHGTELGIAEQLASGALTFRISEGPQHFFGDGVYFFETSQRSAEDFALFRAKKLKWRGIGVIRSQVNLGRCLDLNSREHRDIVKSVADQLEAKGFPQTEASAINYLATVIEPRIDSVRATHTNPHRGLLFADDSARGHTHLYQKLIICVRNTRNILVSELVHRQELTPG